MTTLCLGSFGTTVEAAFRAEVFEAAPEGMKESSAKSGKNKGKWRESRENGTGIGIIL
jgi:hypothetical protein